MRSNLFDYWPHRPFERTANYESWLGDDSYELRVDLPGIEQEDVEAVVDDGVLKIKWQRNAEHEAYSKREYYKEGSLFFTMPDDVSLSKITSSLKNGVLSMSIPKKAAKKPKEITIQIE
jgi:HSP20 family protein